MEKRPGLEIRDPELPAINAGRTGNGMENRRSDSPLPQSLPDAGAKQALE